MKEYKTEDTALATYLFSIGFECLGIEPFEKKPGVLSFIFESSEQLPVAVAMFFNGEASINPQLTIKNYKLFLTMIRNYKKNEQGSDS